MRLFTNTLNQIQFIQYCFKHYETTGRHHQKSTEEEEEGRKESKRDSNLLRGALVMLLHLVQRLLCDVLNHRQTVFIFQL